jgi:hypothetical protein
MKAIKMLIAVAGIAALSGVAIADEVTTSTTTHQTETAPGPGVSVGVPGVVGVHVGAPPVETGCTTKRKTTTDTDTGQSATVTRSDC